MSRIGYLDTAQLAAALSLGSAATTNTGTSGATVPLLNGANTWSGAQTFSGAVTFGTTAFTGAATFNGAVNLFPAASATPASNGEMVFELTSNTTLTIKVKGSDGTVRSVALTLA